MSNDAGSAVEQGRVLQAIYRLLREREPSLFAPGVRWSPGGVLELRMHVSSLIDLVKTHPSDAHCLISIQVCGECQHRTGCGYCVVRQQQKCILDRYAEEIVVVVRRMMDPRPLESTIEDPSHD